MFVKNARTTAIVIAFTLGVIAGYFIAIQTIRPQAQQAVLPEGGVLFLPDETYFGNLTYYLDLANESVYVVMYVVKYDSNEPNDPVNILLRKLVDLYSRGIDVKIVIDDQTYQSYPETISYLVESGVPVRLDESKAKTTHAKIVIIDGKYVFIGSHNWTESALTSNHEATLLVNSSKLAKLVLEYFNGIWSEGRPLK
jgi:phosphatidylserine/phosphatidylglycerophosphate/cardiolipin synthase-like enzyme